MAEHGAAMLLALHPLAPDEAHELLYPVARDPNVTRATSAKDAPQTPLLALDHPTLLGRNDLTVVDESQLADLIEQLPCEGVGLHASSDLCRLHAPPNVEPDARRLASGRLELEIEGERHRGARPQYGTYRFRECTPAWRSSAPLSPPCVTVRMAIPAPVRERFHVDLHEGAERHGSLAGFGCRIQSRAHGFCSIVGASRSPGSLGTPGTPS